MAEDGDVFAFYFPAIDPAKGKPVLGGGEFTVAFADRPEVQKVQTYLASAEYANSRAKLGNSVSANKGLDVTNVPNPIDKLSVEILQDPNTVFRFDGSDLMPAAVGAGTFWKGMIDWINGKDTAATLDADREHLAEMSSDRWSGPAPSGRTTGPSTAPREGG